MDVKTNLLELARLQEIERTLGAVEGDLARIPMRVREIETTLHAAEKGVEVARAALVEAGKLRRSHEGEIDTVKARISKYQDQLMAVKTNEQYKALNSEIATEKKKIEDIEERILLQMERADDCQRAVKETETTLAREKERISREKLELGEEQRRLEGERTALLGDRERVSSNVPRELLSLFRRISQTRGGIAVAPVLGEACRECGVRARPQALAEARTFERIIQCESCGRILLPKESAEAPPAETTAAEA